MGVTFLFFFFKLTVVFCLIKFCLFILENIFVHCICMLFAIFVIVCTRMFDYGRKS